MKTSSILALTASLGLATVASAQVLMLDFGPTTASGANLTNSPYHTVNNTFTDSTWNKIGATTPVGDVSGGGLVSSNNITAGGISINLGITTTTTPPTPTTIKLGTQPGSSSPLGSGTFKGVYSGTSVGMDAIFSGSNTSNTAIGAQIGGLSAGTYDIYVIARNTNVGNNQSAYSQTVFVGTSALGEDFNFSGYTSSTLNYPTGATSADAFTTAWVQGENYVKLSVSITANQALNIAVAGGTTGDTRGFLNAIQIVNTTPVPEPSAFAALAGLGALGFAASRRRRA